MPFSAVPAGHSVSPVFPNCTKTRNAPAGFVQHRRSVGTGLDAFQFQLERMQRQVDVADERDQRREQRGHARDEYHADEESPLPVQQRGHKQGDDERRRQQRAERGQDDAQADHPGAPVKDVHLRQRLRAVFARAMRQFRLKLPDTSQDFPQHCGRF